MLQLLKHMTTASRTRGSEVTPSSARKCAGNAHPGVFTIPNGAAAALYDESQCNVASAHYWRTPVAFDYKKEFKEFYAPTTSPAILTVPPMRFVAVRGSGDPNAEEGQYVQATQLLYGISYTIKMSKKSKDPVDHIDGYHDYVVPPLEGLWWMQDGRGYVVDFSHKDRFEWISMIRLPEFVTDDVFARAKATFGAKHPEVDTELAYLFDFDEGDVAQVLHKGPYDGEPATVAALDAVHRRPRTSAGFCRGPASSRDLPGRSAPL